MFLPSRNTFLFICRSVLSAAVVSLFLVGYTNAQSLHGVNSTGTFGNEVIEGKIYFPKGHRSDVRPVVKLKGDAAMELTTVASTDGSFRFTNLRPDSYTITVDGGSEYQNARESVSIGHGGAVPAQGNPGDYAIPVVYQVQIYLQPKRSRELDSYNERGIQYLKQSEPAKAAELFAEAVKLGPIDFESRLNYGIALLNLKKFVEAEQQLRKAVELNPAAATSHYYFALALLNQQKFEAAEAEFKLSIKDSHDHLALAHKYLGGIYWRNKDYGRAAEELEKYVTQDPKARDVVKIRETIRELRSRAKG